MPGIAEAQAVLAAIGAGPPGRIQSLCPTRSHGTRQLRHWIAKGTIASWPNTDCLRGRTRTSRSTILSRWGLAGPTPRRTSGPSPRRSFESEWKAEAKDRLEWKLRDLICTGQVDVREAQRAIADDWTEGMGGSGRLATSSGVWQLLPASRWSDEPTMSTPNPSNEGAEAWASSTTT
jgi:hypothetical protein